MEQEALKAACRHEGGCWLVNYRHGDSWRSRELPATGELAG